MCVRVYGTTAACDGWAVVFWDFEYEGQFYGEDCESCGIFELY